MNTSNRRRSNIVVSGINIQGGGSLTILESILNSLNKLDSSRFRVIAILSSELKFDLRKNSNIRFHWVQSYSYGYFRKIFYEYVVLNLISKKLLPDLWISMNGFTPIVASKAQVTYFHNVSIFYEASLREYILEPTLLIFKMFMSKFISFNIKKNSYIIVQQAWIRNRFSSRFGFPSENIIVSWPLLQEENKYLMKYPVNKTRDNFVFFYPALPRVFKNFELIIGAFEELLKYFPNCELWLTMKGSENIYARLLRQRCKNILNVRFLGLQSRHQMTDLYKNASCLIFPSKLESWGLPVSEAKTYGLPILSSDSLHLTESVGDYDQVLLFDQGSVSDCTLKMRLALEGKWKINKIDKIEPPFSNSWEDLSGRLASLIK